MAKVKIQGNASGTGVLTVTAPNTSTDRTITLPDGTGTLIADDGSGNLGINTTTPSSLLEVKAGSNSTTDYPITVLNSAESVTTGYGAYGIDQSASSAYTIDVHDDLVIKSNTGENLRVLENGGLTFNGDTAAANALDDYEEGTWTPTITVGTASAASGVYTRVGRLVQCNATLTFPSQSSSTVTSLGGLPFTSATYSHGYAGVIRYTDFSAGQLMITVNSADTNFSLYDVIYGSSTTQTTYTEMSGKRLDFSITYNAA